MAANTQNDGDAMDQLRKYLISQVQTPGSGANRQASSNTGGAALSGIGNANHLTRPGPDGTTLHLFIFGVDQFNDPNTYFGDDPLDSSLMNL